MPHPIEFHFDFGSPNAYLAHKVIPAIESQLNVHFEYIPVLLGGIFKSTGNVSPMESFKSVESKRNYAQLETKRFVEKHKLTEFRHNPHFPINTLTLMRGAVYAKQHDFFERYVNTVFIGMWENQLPLGELEVLKKLLSDAGLPSDAIINGTQNPEIKQQLMEYTDASVGRGTFGAPTFFVEQEMFFGKDKLAEVIAEIEKRHA